MDAENPERDRGLLPGVIARFLIVLVFLGAVFFLTAGTFAYPEAWAYLILMTVLMCAGGAALYRTDRELLRKRLKTRETQKAQVAFVVASSIAILLVYALPGLDRRYGWTAVPTWLVVVGFAVVTGGYVVNLVAMLQNAYASRVVEIQERQTLVDTGLYSIVRHPMYTAIIFIYAGSALALGSFVALAPALLMPFVLALRIANEEKVLREGLPGYEEYVKRVRFKLIPGVW